MQTSPKETMTSREYCAVSLRDVASTARPGFEPGLRGSEPHMLPLHNRASNLCRLRTTVRIARPGLEPEQRESKSRVPPLHYRAKMEAPCRNPTDRHSLCRRRPSPVEQQRNTDNTQHAAAGESLVGFSVGSVVSGAFGFALQKKARGCL